jgi:hypothetical protein
VKRGPALDAEKIRIIKLQAEAVREGAFFLAGGTGLAVRLHHRVSNDLDWFTGEAFDADELRRKLESAPIPPTHIEQQSPHTLRAYYGTFETSFILVRQIPVETEELSVRKGVSIPIAKLELLALMKAAAVHDRGTKRDFVDIYAICGEPGWSVPRFIEHAAAALPLQPEQIALALTYFADAELQPMPAQCTLSWSLIKKTLTAGVRAWEATRKQDSKTDNTKDSTTA